MVFNKINKEGAIFLEIWENVAAATAMKPLTANQDVPQEREHHVKWHPAIT